MGHVVSNPEQQAIGEFACPKIVQKSASGKSLGRVVGYASLCSAARDAFGKRVERAFYGQVAVLGSRNTEKDLHWPTSRDQSL
jgi:hypothetical protein